MREVKTEHLQPGMRLARTLKTPEGAVLLETGVQLTAPLIARLQGMGLGSVHIDEAKPIQQIETEVIRRFRKVADDPIQRQICAAVLHYFRLREQRRDAGAAP